MDQQKIDQNVGVIGAGSFGTAIARLLAYNTNVLLYCRNEAQAQKINSSHENLGVSLPKNITAICDIETLAKECSLIFPIVPSANFRAMIQEIAPFLRPYHILIHGTKGFDSKGIDIMEPFEEPLRPKQIYTMSEIIQDESVVVRIGCLSGPNLAKEIVDGQPTATVIASAFDEVIQLGKKVLSSEQFHVFGTNDIIGAELAGALKNIIAIGSGILTGKGFGKNIQAILINRGLMEMIYFGKKVGADGKSFLGTAGIGDLIATSISKDSRNFTFGYRLGQGEERENIIQSMPELAEGVRTLKIVHELAKYFKLRVPIFDMLHSIVFEGFEVDRAIKFLMVYPYNVDVDFI